mgnify:CR=1 FL=1
MLQMFQKSHWVAVAQTVPVVAVATLIVAGAGWGLDWSTRGTVSKARATGVTEGAQSVLVPYCTAQMVASKEAAEKLKAASTWDRRNIVEKLATTPAGKPVDSATAAACAEAVYEKINATAALVLLAATHDRRSIRSNAPSAASKSPINS